MSVTMVTVVHTMTLIGETAPENITVEVKPAERIWVPGEAASYLPRSVPVVVAGDGTYSFAVPAVDDPALVGKNVSFRVIERTKPEVRGHQTPLQAVHKIAPTMAQAPGPVGLFDTLVDVPVPGGAESFINQVVDQAVSQLGSSFAQVGHDHTRADIVDSSALGRTIMAVPDATTARAELDTPSNNDLNYAVNLLARKGKPQDLGSGSYNANTVLHGDGTWKPLDVVADTSAGTRVMVGGVQVYGHTGWRRIILDASTGVISGRVRIYREDSFVTALLQDVKMVPGTSNTTLWNAIPEGFRPDASERRNSGVGLVNKATASQMLTVWNTNIEWVFAMSDTGNSPTRPSAGLQGSISWPVRANEPWPTTLPGTPA